MKENSLDMEKYLIDTNVLIAYTRQDVKAKNFLQECMVNNSELWISYITAGELLQGARNNVELTKIDKMLENFEVNLGTIPISKKALELMKKYYLSHNLLQQHLH